MKHRIIVRSDFFNIAEYRKYQYFHYEAEDTIVVLPYFQPGVKILGSITDVERWSKSSSSRNTRGAVLLRKEDVPCWQVNYEGPDQKHWTCIAGGVHDGESCFAAMVRELREETGIELVDYEVLVEDGPRYIGKMTNMRQTQYVLSIKIARVVETLPDSEYEKNSETVFVPIQDLDGQMELLLDWPSISLIRSLVQKAKINL